MTPRFPVSVWGYSRAGVDRLISSIRATVDLTIHNAHAEEASLETANAELEREMKDMAAEALCLLKREAQLAQAIMEGRKATLQMTEDARTLASQMLASARDDLYRRRGDLMTAEKSLRALVAVLESLALQHAVDIADRPGEFPDRTARRQ